MPKSAHLTLGEAAHVTNLAMDACNLSGLAHDFPDIMEAVWDDVRAHGGGTDQANTHPLSVLWVQKMADLAGLTVDALDPATLERAFAWLRESRG